MRRTLVLSACLIACGLLNLSTRAEEDRAAETAEQTEASETAASDPAELELTVFERLHVIGNPASLREIPGSAHVIDREQLETHGFNDVHRALRQVPGINIQEEEGYGLRPNIGMRGTGAERSSKITLLEDGVLIAPAPYSASAAYYFPVLGRMESIEVRKGSASIRQGPFTTGGVLNLISTSIPSDFGGRVDFFAGDNQTLRGRLALGDSDERFGWLFETYQLQTDGFKELDGGGDTGVELQDYLLKLRLHSRPEAERYQALELKLGHTEQVGDETYLGLTQADFRAHPFRRYAASQADVIDTEHDQIQLRHFVQLTPQVNLTTTIYRNEFFRNWAKLQSVRGVGIGSVLDAPETYVAELAILRGEIDSDAGDLRLRNNRRSYYSEGIQSVFAWHPNPQHDLEVGIRWHRDEEDRFQEEDRYQMLGGEMTFVAPGIPGSQANRVSDAEALAIFVQDRIRLGRVTLTPGLRFESIDFTRTDFSSQDPQRTDPRLRNNQVDVWIPGLGVDFLVNPTTSVFGGVHKGFAPPSPGANALTDSEESINYELGVRRQTAAGDLQAVVFFSDYDNLLGRDTLSSGGEGTDLLFNGGEVEVRGLEFSAQTDLAERWNLGVQLPVRVAYTYTAAEFSNSFESDFGPWAPLVEAGDELPYLPEHQIFARLGVVHDRWSGSLDTTWVDEMRTRAGSGPIAEGDGTDAHLLLDLSLGYEVLEGLKLVGQIRNLTDEVYVAARRPAGVRPGLPRTALVGFQWGF